MKGEYEAKLRAATFAYEQQSLHPQARHGGERADAASREKVRVAVQSCLIVKLFRTKL